MKRLAIMLLVLLWAWPVDAAGDGKLGRDTLNKWLHKAAFSGDVQLAKKALDLGADVNEKFLGLTPLYNASTYDHLGVVKELVERGAKVNIPSGPARRTPLHQAALKGRKRVVLYLIQNGANVNARNTFNRTPLGYVLNPPLPLKRPENYREIAKLLAKFGGTE